MDAHTHTHTHTHARARGHTQTHTHTHTHAHAPRLACTQKLMSIDRKRAHLSVNGSLVHKDVIPAVGRGDETVCRRRGGGKCHVAHAGERIRVCERRQMSQRVAPGYASTSPLHIPHAATHADMHVRRMSEKELTPGGGCRQAGNEKILCGCFGDGSLQRRKGRGHVQPFLTLNHLTVPVTLAMFRYGCLRQGHMHAHERRHTRLLLVFLFVTTRTSPSHRLFTRHALAHEHHLTYTAIVAAHHPQLHLYAVGTARCAPPRTDSVLHHHARIPPPKLMRLMSAEEAPATDALSATRPSTGLFERDRAGGRHAEHPRGYGVTPVVGMWASGLATPGCLHPTRCARHGPPCAASPRRRPQPRPPAGPFFESSLRAGVASLGPARVERAARDMVGARGGFWPRKMADNGTRGQRGDCALSHPLAPSAHARASPTSGRRGDPGLEELPQKSAARGRERPRTATNGASATK